MALTPVRLFCHGSPTQFQQLANKRIDTLKDLLVATRFDVDMNMRHETNPPGAVNVCMVYKRHIIGYSKRHLDGIFIDFDLLTRDYSLFMGGV